jgi:hypothetical protein
VGGHGVPETEVAVLLVGRALAGLVLEGEERGNSQLERY